jgi:hypothetical protein
MPFTVAPGGANGRRIVPAGAVNANASPASGGTIFQSENCTVWR